MKLLENIVVIDFSQFLSGPSASLRLSDFGAQVIKIERPVTGDICRQLYVSDIRIEGESTIFHAINRNKQSYAADLKNENDIEKIRQLIARADVLIHNFRPGVMKRLGLGYEEVKAINPAIVYAEISGYGEEGPWRALPGQDLLLQAVSGLTWLSGNKDKEPTPMGVAVVDILAGTHLVQGILAALYQRGINGEGLLVQVSMLESVLDFQFELLTCFYNDGQELPERSAVNNGNVYVSAPYGIYKTKNGYMALAMTNIPALGLLINCAELEKYTDSSQWFIQRNEIKQVLADHLQTRSTEDWLFVLEPADVWCAPVFDYENMVAHEAYQALHMEQEVRTSNGLSVKTTRCPIRVDGEILLSGIGAPLLGEHSAQVEIQFEVV